MTNDPRVIAIRNDPAVGGKTCSNISECYSDEDLIEALDEAGVLDVIDAIRWARDIEKFYIEARLNARWGDDDDVELVILRDFEKNCGGDQ